MKNHPTNYISEGLRIFTDLRRLFGWFLLACGLVSSAVGAATDPVTVALTSNQKAAFSIVVGTNAASTTVALAAELTQMLGKLTGVEFKVEKGDGKTGIAIGVSTDFPATNLDALFDVKDSAQREDYIIRTHASGVYLIGATDGAVRHAVWDFLYRLGYRQYFPGKHWEVMPSKFEPRISINVVEHADYFARRIWYGWGSWNENMQDLTNWNKKNRMGEGLNLHSGHAYEKIYKSKQVEFDKHPEYLCSTNPVKFVVSNPGLQKLVADYAVQYFFEHPEADGVSLEPGDGDGWVCPVDEKEFKSVSDRVVTLANIAAVAINQKYRNKYVAIYAYFKHSPPPTIRIHPNVFVGVATAFIQGGFTVDQLASGWRGQGATIGIREYYSIHVQHKDRPGGPAASDLFQTANNIRKFYGMGARAMSAESSENWGPSGLSYYVASRLLWNTKEDVDTIVNDFFLRSFGSAEQPMRDFYRTIDRANKPIFNRALIGRMYRQLDAAYRLANNDGIRGRLDDLTLYTRYLELLWALQEAKGKQQETEAVLSFSYRIRSTGMVHNYALWRDTRGGFNKPEGATAWDVPEGKNPLKVSKDFLPGEITGFIEQGIRMNPVN
jgi:Domain of unknown function (DUF4838)